MKCKGYFLVQNEKKYVPIRHSTRLPITHMTVVILVLYSVYIYNDGLYAFRFLFWFYFSRRINIYGQTIQLYNRNRKKNKYNKHPFRFYPDKTQINRFFVILVCIPLSIILSQ